MNKSYVIEYLNENSYRQKERSIKKYNMLAFKKMYFEIYPELREGKFKGVLVDTNEETDKYELELPTDEIFKKAHGPLVLHYTVYKNQKIVMLNTLTPEDVLTEGHHKELTGYKGVMATNNSRENDMFKINLLNMISKD